MATTNKLITETTLSAVLKLIAGDIKKKADDEHSHSDLASISYVDSLVSTIHKFDVEVVDALPTTGTEYKIYFLRDNDDTNNICHEYIWINNAWERIGDTEIDLSNYYTETETDTAIANAVTEVVGNIGNLNGFTAKDVVGALNEVLVKVNAIKLNSLTDGTYTVTMPQENGVIATQGFVSDSIANAVTGGQIDLSGYSKVGHKHEISDVNGLQGALDLKATKEELTNNVTTLQTNINNLDTELDNHNHDDTYMKSADYTLSTELDATTWWNEAKA